MNESTIQKIIDAAVLEAEKLVRSGSISERNSYYWMLANARVRSRMERKGKKWSERKILRKTRARYYTRKIWMIGKAFAPRPLGGTLVTAGEYIEHGADRIAELLRQGKL